MDKQAFFDIAIEAYPGERLSWLLANPKKTDRGDTLAVFIRNCLVDDALSDTDEGQLEGAVSSMHMAMTDIEAVYEAYKQKLEELQKQKEKSL